MKTLAILKNVNSRFITIHYYKNEEEAHSEWGSWPTNLDWELIYLRERRPSGHRYELECAKFDDCGELYPKYIICFSKKEALYLKELIRGVNSNYLFNIKKLY